MKILILFILITLTGCASFTSPARYHELDSTKNYWFDYDATRRGTVLVNTGSLTSCSEPAPDAAIGLVAKLQGSLTVADRGDAKAEAELTQDIVKLAERTQMVLFLRESLYRLCELSINKNLSVSDSKELYASVISAALKLVEKEKAEVDVERLRLEKDRLIAANQAQHIYQFLSNKGVEQSIIEELLKGQ